MGIVQHLLKTVVGSSLPSSMARELGTSDDDLAFVSVDGGRSLVSEGS